MLKSVWTFGEIVSWIYSEKSLFLFTFVYNKYRQLYS